MKPYYADDWLTVYFGDCRAVLAEMPAESVHCVVTSPPYWGLRDYGTEGQLGLEPTPEAYVENMVEVFRGIRRVLRSDGTVWLNLGDSYSGSWSGHSLRPEGGEQRPGEPGFQPLRDGRYPARPPNVPGLKPKDLVGIPWRVAFALQADGWYLRSDIIWAKPNPMPESVTDRPTKAHEYLFLLSKSPRYYWDAEAVREGLADPDRQSDPYDNTASHQPGATVFRVPGGYKRPASGMRNLRSVWTIATQPYPGAHFATFPRALVEPCVKAGTSEKGVCPECGAPWERVVERTGALDESRPQSRRALALVREHGLTPEHLAAVRSVGVTDTGKARVTQDGTGKNDPAVQALADEAKQVLGGYYRELLLDRGQTTGWRPSCVCHEERPAEAGRKGRHAPDSGPAWSSGTSYQPVPATVLDPFAGSGTTGMVAQSLSRRAVLIDLNGEYLEQAMERNRDVPLGLPA